MTLPGMIDPSRLAWQNECEGWLLLGEALSDASPFRCEVAQDITCAWWQGKVGEMENYLMLPSGFAGDLEKALQTMALDMENAGVVCVLRYLQADERPEWRPILSHNGFILADTAPLLAVPLQGWYGGLQVNHQVRVARVEASCEYQEACTLVQRVFGGPLAVTRFFAQPGLSPMYAAWLEQRLVAAATLWPFGGAAGVYSVSTDPELRRKGIATALLHQMLQDAMRDGFPYATLRTTDNLIQFYSRCGFKSVGRVVRWIRLRTESR